MGLTEQQKDAVEKLGSNIIISAGAGSGKTKVLSERVFKHILVDKYDIDRMLILTFTKAAASEMKERIRRILADNKDNVLSKEEQNKQLNKLDSSYVMTFDAFTLSLLKKYHQLLDIDDDIEIIDKNVLKNITKSYVDEVFLEHYTKEDEKFLKLINHFSIKDDEKLKSSVIHLNDSLNQMYKRQEFIDDYKKNFYSKETLDNLVNAYVGVLKVKIRQIDNLLNKISEYVEDINAFYPTINDLKNIDSYDLLRETIKITTINGKVKNNGDDKEGSKLRAKIKALTDELITLTSYSKDELIKQVLNTSDDVFMLLELARELNDKLIGYKKKNNIYEYVDISKLSIKLVDEHVDIRNEIRDYFKEILIDEYQDTNDLQDDFIFLIENNNVYMVGDIKQSIYGFRNANPNLFKSKYEKYKQKDGGIAIDLTNNFRSRQEVLDDINIVFNRIMTAELGGVNYTNGQQMVAGNNAYQNEGCNKQNNHLELLRYVYDRDTKNTPPFDILTKAEVEAFIIAQDIKNKVDNGYLVADYDGDKMILRKASYKDFSILIDRSDNFDMFKQVLTYFNIPSLIKKDDKMSDSDLLVVIKNIFKLLTIDDFKAYEFKYAFASVARSFLSNINDEDLFNIIKKQAYLNTDIYKHILAIKNGIDFKDNKEIIDEIINEFNIYENIYKIGDVKENLIKINYLYDLANNLSLKAFTYKDFSEYLDGINEKNDIEYKSEKEILDAVTITTIHKSKGLEYPIVYLPILYRKFNNEELKNSILFSKELGIVLPEMVEGRGLRNTFANQLFKYNFNLDDVSEKIRLFYVALTRAKEKLILIGPINDDSKKEKIISKEDRLSIDGFKRLLELIYDDLDKNNSIKDIDFNDYKFTTKYHDKKTDIFSKLKKTDEKILVDKIDKIKPLKLEEGHFSKNSGLIDVATMQKMEFGTKLHYYLETLDFNNPNYELIDNAYTYKIKAFLNSDLTKDIKKAKVYKEYEFIYTCDNKEKHGIIDLLLEYEDRFVIIDYKTKNIDDEHYDEQLKGYSDYIASISDKKVECYLYSLIDEKYREVI